MPTWRKRLQDRLESWKARTDESIAEENRFQAKVAVGCKQSWPLALVLALVLGPAPVMDMWLDSSTRLPEHTRHFIAWAWVPMLFIAFWLFPAIKAAFVNDDSTDATPAGLWRLVRSNSFFIPFCVAMTALVAWMVLADRAARPLVEDLSLLSGLTAIGLILLVMMAEPGKRSGNHRGTIEEAA